MCESHLDHRLLVRETEARLAGVRVNETLTEKDKEEAQGLLANARDAVLLVLRKARHV